MWTVPFVVGLALRAGMTNACYKEPPLLLEPHVRLSLTEPALTSPRNTRCVTPPPVGSCSRHRRGYFYNYDTGHCQHYRRKCGEYDDHENYFTNKSSCAVECQPMGPTVVCRALVLQVGCNRTEGAYHFNGAIGKCEYSPTGGCSPGINSFKTLKQCKLVCQADRLSGVCSLPMAQGFCMEAHHRYHFDYLTRECVPFTYGGCNGNGNNFHSIDECQRTCYARWQKCTQHLARGRCGGSMKRWYFDTNTRACMNFSYSGCEGNQNNFVSRRNCEVACFPVMKPVTWQLWNASHSSEYDE
ncbi:carboxypeptidase inhibitor SmCI-like isoform X1 [Ornithodoros turicata]|uniref:carboxypeptidase inhibitor SmCI-like isoform X1 n=1 Tax=Ornithodoros turicata TaxID=34597 RepID=UPI003139F18B